jgi:flagellar hook-associated protein 1
MASLFGTIQQSANALGVAQIGLQVVGNNIGNANTDGYIRQELQQASAPGTRQGGLILGHGVRPTGIVQKVDQQLVERMINAKNALSSAESLETAYNQLEELTADLNGGGLSNQLTLFNNALQELSTQPNDPSLRDFVILQGETLSAAIRQNREDAFSRSNLYNNNLNTAVDDINRLTSRIASLNVEIATIEGGGLSNSDATGLRDQRYLDLEKLAEYVNVNFQEQESGVVNIFVGGDYLVSSGNSREVYAAYDSVTEGTEIRIRETDSPLDATGGTVAAAKAARDEVFGKYVKELDEMAAGLIRAVNEIHSDGQGSSGFQTLTATNRTDANVPLTDAGLAFVPRNGTFDLNVVDERGKVISTNRIEVRLLGQVTDSTMSSVTADIDAIDGLNATVDANGLIRINTDSPTAGFTFHNDNSGFLAAAGINTFFNGKNGFDIAINPMLKGNPDLLAISKNGINEDTEALTQLIGVVDRPYSHLDGQSVRESYERTLTDMAQQVSVQKSSAEGLGNFYNTLRSQHLAITGVNIDEEAIKMIAYQRSFQASSRVITTANEMLDILMAL